MSRFAPLTLLPVLAACTVQSSTSSHYLSAEQLWTAKNYRGAVAEFDYVVKESPNSPVGLQALWRAATTREWFLGEYEEALKGFELLLERAGNSELAPRAQIEVGEIYFSRLGRHQKAIEHYEKLLASGGFGPEDRAKFAYRIGRSHFLMNRLKKAIGIFEGALANHPGTAMVPRIKFDLANAWYALGETDRAAYPKALRIFEELSDQVRHSDHRLYVESIFGAAAILEEQDELEKAFERFRLIENDYPAPNVVKVRLYRIAERMKKKQK